MVTVGVTLIRLPSYTAHGKNWQCRKKVERHSKTKFNPKFIVESKNLKEMF